MNTKYFVTQSYYVEKHVLPSKEDIMRRSRQRERISTVASHLGMTNAELARMMKVSERQIYTDRRAMRTMTQFDPTPAPPLDFVVEAPLLDGAAPPELAPAPEAPDYQAMYEQARKDPTFPPAELSKLFYRAINTMTSTPPRE